MFGITYVWHFWCFNNERNNQMTIQKHNPKLFSPNISPGFVCLSRTAMGCSAWSSSTSCPAKMTSTTTATCGRGGPACWGASRWCSGLQEWGGTLPFFFFFTSSVCMRSFNDASVIKLHCYQNLISSWISTHLTRSNHRAAFVFCLIPLFRREGPRTMWRECTVCSSC